MSGDYDRIPYTPMQAHADEQINGALLALQKQEIAALRALVSALEEEMKLVRGFLAI